MAGCFPLVVQMPILIGFYHAIIENNSNCKSMLISYGLILREADPYYILPIVAGITTFIQQKMIDGWNGK